MDDGMIPIVSARIQGDLWLLFLMVWSPLFVAAVVLLERAGSWAKRCHGEMKRARKELQMLRRHMMGLPPLDPELMD